MYCPPRQQLCSEASTTVMNRICGCDVYIESYKKCSRTFCYIETYSVNILHVLTWNVKHEDTNFRATDNIRCDHISACVACADLTSRYAPDLYTY
jgi:hypothetical protein